MNLARTMTAAALLATSLATPAAPAAPLAKVPFSSERELENFAGNCQAVTTLVDKFFGYRSSSCKATRGVVMIRASAHTEKVKNWAAFYGTALTAAGRSVNDDYYGPGAYFVIGNDRGEYGCLMILGDDAARHQRRMILSRGKDMEKELRGLFDNAKKVECPDFLR